MLVLVVVAIVLSASCEHFLELFRCAKKSVNLVKNQFLFEYRIVNLVTNLLGLENGPVKPWCQKSIVNLVKIKCQNVIIVTNQDV